MQLRPAGQAGLRAGDVLGAASDRLGGGVFIADVAVHPVCRLAGLLDERGYRADRRIGQMAGHSADGRHLENYVGVRDENGFGPVVGQDLA